METIKDKLRKIKALADRGVDGEAKAAQTQLEKLLAKYNLIIEDIFDKTLQPRMFKVASDEKQLFAQILSSNIGDRYREAFSYRGKPSEVYIQITDSEYVDIEQQFTFHKKQIKKEIKKAIDKLKHAYIIKHDIFNKDKQPVSRSESGMNIEEYYEIMGIVNKLEDVTFRKQLKS